MTKNSTDSCYFGELIETKIKLKVPTLGSSIVAKLFAIRDLNFLCGLLKYEQHNPPTKSTGFWQPVNQTVIQGPHRLNPTGRRAISGGV